MSFLLDCVRKQVVFVSQSGGQTTTTSATVGDGQLETVQANANARNQRKMLFIVIGIVFMVVIFIIPLSF